MITLNKEIKAQLVDGLQAYFDRELDSELGQFDAEFLLDFISQEFGKHYYNQGLYDAQAIIESKVETLTEAMSELEK